MKREGIESVQALETRQGPLLPRCSRREKCARFLWPQHCTTRLSGSPSDGPGRKSARSKCRVCLCFFSLHEMRNDRDLGRRLLRQQRDDPRQSH
ncbi:hypothetical protein E2C01_072683 [Portunus trituberculatus]|uniref:Uncharacterized protein n=1 Tax=Portunus trituberculatus TaxID=210409 RepID=A0A5B7HYP8_PORTR|nr:hypothetical protein [Portunus trituberculatus]